MRAPKNRLSGLSTVLRALCAGYLIWHPVLAQAAGQASTFGTGANSFTIDFVTIGNPGNPAYAVTGFGAVGFHYKIMQFEFTNSQYAAFLNSIDPDGTNPNAVYSSSMGTEAVGGIANTGTTKGSHYVIKTNMGDKPVNYVSWWDAARVSSEQASPQVSWFVRCRRPAGSEHRHFRRSGSCFQPREGRSHHVT